jgi:Glycosyltransferase family 87
MRNSSLRLPSGMGFARTVLALLLLAAGLVFLARQRPAGGYSYRYGSIGSRDFIQYWSAYRALRAGTNPYDGLVLHPIERSVGQSPDATIFMWNPPWTVLLIAPVLRLPFGAACLVWIGCNLALVASIGLIVGDLAWLKHGQSLVMPAIVSGLLFYPAMETIALGQISLVLALGAALFLRSAVKENDAAAGLSLVLLSIKPHLFLIFGAWVAYWVIREKRWRIPAFAAIGLFAWVLLASALWPTSLLDWWTSMGQPPRGPGAESTANWMTSSLASWVRLALLHATGYAPLWPMTIIPLLGLALTVLYLAIVRPLITWPVQIHPVLCLSVGLAPYGWPFDHSVLVLGQIMLVTLAMQPEFPPSRRLAIFAALAAMLILPVELEGPNSGHHLLAWYPWASLFLWTWATGGKLQQRLPERSVQRSPGAEQRGRITCANVEPTQSHPIEPVGPGVVHPFPR